MAGGRARAHRFLGRLVPPVRRQRDAGSRRGGARHRAQPADPARLPAQPRAVLARHAGRAPAEEGAGLDPRAAGRGVTWLLHRVDDRLIHGQVVVAWGQRMNPQRIWVVDDAVATSDWERELVESSAPDITVRVCSVADAAAAWAGERDAEGGAFLLVRDLRVALRLVRAGAAPSRLNLGGLHY